MSESDIQALLDNNATIETRIEILPLSPEEDSIILDQDNHIINWNHEDFRYVDKEGWIGQFVARKLTAELTDTINEFYIGDREVILYLGIKVDDTTTWYSLGNFLINQLVDDEVKDKTSIEGLDYTKKFNKDYVSSITYPCTALELAQNVCEQCECELGNTSFKNADYTIDGEVFTNGESCRDVMKAIGKLAFSWVRVDWDNKVYIDWIPQTEISNENVIDNSLYYSLTTKKNIFGPVNRIVIGYSQIDGEQSEIEDEDSINANGLCELDVWDNPLVYNQDQRELVIEQARDLLGMTYTPLTMETVGHPWLKGSERIEAKDMNNVSRETYPFDRTIKYFGHIKTKISSTAPSITDSEYAYKNYIEKRLRNTQISVDKANQKITNTISDLTGLQDTVNNIDNLVDNINNNQDTISGQITQLQQTLDNFQFRIVDIENNGVTQIKNTMVTIDINGISVATSDSAISTLITNDSFIIKNYDTTLAQFNNDGAFLDNLTVNKYFVAGYHRIEKYEENGEKRTGHFYMGGNY